MASLDMQGAYYFSSKVVDIIVTETSPGNYALGETKDKTFFVKYVGRSDTDINKELKSRLPSDHPEFKYSYATSAKAAFEKECYNYHDLARAKN